ncbi:MAG: aspartate aminotransferase family protein [Candidatus Velthaea sp.]
MTQGLERIVTAIPGPRSRALQAGIAAYEARGVTYLADDYPVFWQSAHGARVTDVDGNVYLDLTSAFGVANSGHANDAVVAAAADQMRRLMHAMGDVHPTEVKARLLAALAEITPGDLQKTYLTTSGAEAVEFALKTAVLATGKSRFLAYRGAYHGLSVGTLEVIGIPKFRAPFASLVGDRTTWLDFPGAGTSAPLAVDAARAALERDDGIAAVVVEPIQGRGGVIVPPSGFLRGLRAVCDERGVLLIADEIYTGFGRTGPMFACERDGVVPDLLCLGKALGGGMPLAATVGRPQVMDAWPKSTGEALHTSTYLGNPVACAAALANIAELRRLDVTAHVRRREPWLRDRLVRFAAHDDVVDVRGAGFLWGIEFRSAAAANRVVVTTLARGVILLQSGPTGTSVTIAPPLVIGDAQLARALDLTESVVGGIAVG